jgi:predicted house-cleaning noncanonical NTP pyrophosphatase (MazG superfamily)
MKKGKVIDKANRYHTCKQTKRKAVEEVGEFLHAFMKWEQFKDEKWEERTLEEIADAMLALKQLAERIDPERYRYWKKRKLKRLNRRLNKIEKEND